MLPKGGPDGRDVGLLGDPDCFRVGDTYYAYSAAENVPLCRSTDLVEWSYVGPFLKHDMPDVAIGEDISCANFFQLDGKWVLCASVISSAAAITSATGMQPRSSSSPRNMGA